VPGKLTSLLAVIRYREAVIFQTPSLVALALYLPDFAPDNLWRALLLSLGCFLIMAYIFAYNDWADFALDHQVPGQSKNTFLYRGITAAEMLSVAIGLATAGTLIVALVSVAVVPVVLLMVLLGLAYSLPIRGLKGKSIPVYSSFLHFTGILLVFVFGAMAFSPIQMRGLLVGSYFGILITAGHLVQEVQDYAGDRSSKVSTNAVKFGQRPMFVFAFVLFAFSFVVLYALAQAGLVPAAAKYSLLLFPIYAVWAARAYRAGLDEKDVRRLRNQYRLLFAIVVLVISVSAVLQR